jgi:NAD(P)-dependent dehydrogenase (short-subunit alcohol dehydrogenase family)
MTLEGKTILITGAGVRLGRAMAIAIARDGGNIILHYNRSRKPAEETQAEIESLGGSAHLLQSDLGDSESAQQLITEAFTISPLYALVNSASMFESLELHSTSPEAWDLHIKVNLTAPFLLSKSFTAINNGD